MLHSCTANTLTLTSLHNERLAVFLSSVIGWAWLCRAHLRAVAFVVRGHLGLEASEDSPGWTP